MALAQIREAVRPWQDAPPGVPPGGEIQWHEMRDGVRIRLGLWTVEQGRGTVLVLPGRTEFIEKYGETVSDLISRGFSVVVPDWRGQGLSDRCLDNRLKGHVDDFATFVEDFREIMTVVRDRLRSPYLQLCHSMGGNIGARVLAAEPTGFVGAAFTGPMFGLNTGALPGPLVHAISACGDLLNLKNRYIPGGSDTSVLDEEFADNVVTGDAIRFARNKKYVSERSELALGPPTLGWLYAAIRSINLLKQRGIAESISVPALFVLAGNETLTDNAAAKRFAERMKNAHVLEISSAKHEILQEQDEVRAEFWSAFDAFANAALQDAR